MKSSWKKIKLGNLIGIINGYAFNSADYKNSGYQVIRITNVQDGYISNSNYKAVQLDNLGLDKFILDKGDLLISMTGNVGRVGIIKEVNLPAVLNQRVAKIIIKDNQVIPEFLYYFFMFGGTRRKLESESKGIAQKNLNSKSIEDLDIFLPQLAEQKHIVSVLNKVVLLIEKRKEEIQLLDEYLKAVFLDMFGDPVTNKKKWEFSKVGDYITYLADIGSNGANEVVSKNLKMHDTEDYAIMIRTTNLSANDFKHNLKYVSKDTYEFFSKSKVFGGELIMNKIGSAGQFWIMPQLNKPVTLGLNQFLIRFKDINIIYLYYFLKTDFSQRKIASSLRGAVTKSITKTAVKELPLMDVPMNLQIKFSDIYTIQKSIKAKMELQLDELEKNFQLLLTKTFSR